MYQIGYFVLPASDTVENHTRIRVQLDIPLLLPGQSLYQCTWVPTSDGYADVAALNSVLLVSTRAEELVGRLPDCEMVDAYDVAEDNSFELYRDRISAEA